MYRIGLFIILFCLIIITISSCNSYEVYEDYVEIPSTGWHKDSLAVFNIPVSDTLQNHNLILNVRNDVEYEYSNLWLFIEIHQPGGKTAKDTFEVALADATGKWLGDGFGGIKNKQAVFRTGIYFPVSGEYTVNIQHGMREEILTGITDIGFKVKKAN